MRKPLLVSSGEPAGIGPDVCLSLVGHPEPLVVLCDKELLAKRSKQLGLTIDLVDYVPGVCVKPKEGQLTVLPSPGLVSDAAGELNAKNAPYVMGLLADGVQRCLDGEFSGLVTAPVHKGILNEGGYAFTGHTEFLAEACGGCDVVMLLACKAMRMALVTTHLALREVPDAITVPRIQAIVRVLHEALKHDFGVVKPCIGVAGLNPHAGESGHLGREELDVIIPALELLRDEGMHVLGPKPADTLFTEQGIKGCDALLAMYHDQGLPVLKYAGFGEAVNITLGLPMVRTSVDHGTALDLAGTGRANAESLKAAVNTAANIVKQRECTDVSG
ncbi:MAG: 4-hydroxythreonine-4-phosphate dehydrogenase PdxA [Legionellaceae bacterium]|nr:4-hydroxythreonine-4-phosphate dehydrogenase PdxA [Legionellaceae bacterium]